MSPSNGRTTLVALVVLTVLTAGCVGVLPGDDGANGNGVDDTPDNGVDANGDDGADTDEPDPDALQEDAIEATNEIETASVEMTETIEEATGTVSVESTGVMDFENERAEMELSVDSPLGSQEFTQYIIGDTLYLEDGGEWIQQDVSEEEIWETDEVAQQQEALEIGDVTGVEATEFDGHEVYELEIAIDGDELMDAVIEEGELDDPTAQFEYTDVELTQYVDAETNYVRHTEMNVTAEDDTGESATVAVELTFDDINDPVDIELPEEAEDAPEAPTGPGGTF